MGSIQRALISGLFLLFTSLVAPAVFGCAITGECCSADVGNCATGKTCVCTKACGPTTASCKCSCNDGGNTVIPRVTGSLNDAFPLSTGMTYNVNGGTLTLDALAAYLQNQTRWTVQVEEAAEAYTASGTWSGTMEQVLAGIASAYGVNYTIYNDTKTILFTTP